AGCQASERSGKPSLEWQRLVRPQVVQQRPQLRLAVVCQVQELFNDTLHLRRFTPPSNASTRVAERLMPYRVCATVSCRLLATRLRSCCTATSAASWVPSKKWPPSRTGMRRRVRECG